MRGTSEMGEATRRRISTKCAKRAMLSASGPSGERVSDLVRGFGRKRGTEMESDKRRLRMMKWRRLR
jgi:hypothetical protein